MNSSLTLESIFFDAIAKTSAAEQEAYLADVCAGNAELRRNVDRMLAAQESVGDFLERPAIFAGVSAEIEPVICEGPGTVIGPYKLLQQIGEGGMGVVFMAEQSQPIQRTIALKIIKPGMDTRQVIARFEAERQALALMDHPNIARVIDAGTTSTGRPYFVMELVKGVPITSYCDHQQFSVPQRLELISSVCHAVQHAHQKGIIHRDLKPTNVLVAEYDGHPVPKIIDFGVAKATARRLTEKTMFTEYGQLVGTFEYMSPEQARFNQLDVDTRSDIYSLGVLLYEVLAGSTPLEKERLRAAAFDEVRRMISEEEPQMPSIRLSTSKMLSAISAQRHIEPAKLKKLMRGELDWIVMKCLEKDRNRRYETASALATDLQRYLANEPVEARPTSHTYRLQIFIRRNKAGVLAGAAIVAALAIGMAIASVEFVQARRQAEIANSEAMKATAAQSSAEAALLDKDHALHEKEAALNLAEEKEQLQRRRFYAAQMNLAEQSLDADNPARVLDILDQQRPHAGEIDLRGFEWFYLWGQIHRGLRTSVSNLEGRDHWGLAISPDGNIVALGGDPLQGQIFVKLWDASTGKLLDTLSTGTSGPSRLAFSPDGATLAIGSWDGSVCLWNLAKRSAVARVPSNFGLVRSLQFSPNGKQLVVGFENGAIQTMDSTSLKTRETLKPHGGPVVNAFYSPDGNRLYSATAWGTEGTLTRVHDLTRDPPEAADELKHFRATDISPDGRFLVGGWEEGITLWNISERQAVWQFAAHSHTVNDVKFTADGKSIISAGIEDRLAIVWNIAARKATMRAPHPDEVEVIACAPKNSQIWASLSDDGTAKVWSLTPQTDTGTIRLENPINRMAAMPGGRELFVSGDFFTRTWDLTAGHLTTDEFSATDVRSISADGQLLVGIDTPGVGAESTIKIWDKASGELRQAIVAPNHKLPNEVRISPDGTRVAACVYDDGPVLIWDLSGPAGNVREPLKISARDPKDPNSPLNLGTKSIAFSPNGVWLAAACQFGVVNLYNLSTNQVVNLPIPSASWASQVAFSSDGKLLASGNDQGVVSVFDMEKAEVVASLAGHEAAISALTFFPDSRTLAVGSLGTIRLWDLPSNQERIALRVSSEASGLEPAHVEDLAVTPDGSTLISRLGDGTVRLWHGDSVAGDQTQTAANQVKPANDRAGSSPRFFARRAIVQTGLGHWDQAMSDFQQAERLGIKWDEVLIKLMIEALPPRKEAADSSESDVALQVRQHIASITAHGAEAKPDAFGRLQEETPKLRDSM